MNSIEVLTNVSGRLVEAVMMHSNFDDLFRYLGVSGLAKSQEYQFISENEEMKRINHYAIEHLNHLIINKDINLKKYLPTEFTDIDRTTVSTLDKRDLIRYAVETWVNWETETKEFYSNWHNELSVSHEIGCTLVMDSIIKDVDYELKRATDIMVALKNTDYNMNTITLMQDILCKTYSDMICRTLKNNERSFKNEYFKLS